MKRYYNTTKENNFIKVTTGYELGGYSYFSGQKSNRGYYIYVQPVEQKNGMESFVMFEGLKQMLIPVTRSSKKSEKEANRVASEIVEEFISKYVESKGIILTGEMEEVQ